MPHPCRIKPVYYFLTTLLLCYSCQKQIPYTPPETVDPSLLRGDQEHISSTAVLGPSLMMPVYDSEYPEQLVQYIQTRQAFEGIPSGGNRSYYFTPATNGGNGTTGHGQPILIDHEDFQTHEGVNVKTFLECFAALPDAGASCSLTLFADLPSDLDPDLFFNVEDGYPGHSFLQLSKTSGGKTITRAIGFYPDQFWKTIISKDKIPGKFVDNGQHEYNARIQMSVTPEQLKVVVAAITVQAKIVSYDVDDFNCTNFAVGIFNKARVSDPIIVPLAKFGELTKPMSTPQGLYQEIRRRRNANRTDLQLQIVSKKTYASASSGSCH